MGKTGRRGAILKGAVIAALSATLAFAAVGCSGSNEQASTTPTDTISATFGYWGGTCEAPIYVAYEKGFLAEEGIDANMLQITSGTSAILASGELDFFEATPNFFPAIANGTEVTLIDNVHTGCIQAVATPESGIQSIQDLPGKTVSTFAANDMGYIFLSAAMREAGLDPSTVNWVVYGDGATNFQAMEAGEIDAFVNFDPYGELGSLAGYTKFFNNATDKPFSDYTCCFLAMNNLTLNGENGDELAARACRALEKAGQYIAENPEEVAQLIQEKGYVADSDQVLGAYNIAGTSADIHADLLKSYSFPGGNEKMFNDSIEFCWKICGEAGGLPGAPTDEAELQTYIDDLTSRGMKYYGSK